MIKRKFRRLLNAAGFDVTRANHGRSVTSMDSALGWLVYQGFVVETVLDVGASDGRWSRGCMSWYPNATYVLFDANPIHYPALDAFAEACRSTVLIEKRAVGGVDGRARFDASDPLGGVLVDGEDGRSIDVEVATLDSVVGRLPVSGPFLLKLDTHGVEGSILSGAANLLDSCSVLVIESYNHRITEEALLFWEMCSLLNERGFRPARLVDVLNRDLDDSFWQVDIVFVKATWDGFNHLNYR
jgi:FkbM family methyltransferase